MKGALRFASFGLAAAAFTAVVSGFSAPAAACGYDPTLGEVCVFAGRFCPVGTLPADGRLLPVAENQALYSLLGDVYGGEGYKTFALPDLRGRTVIGLDRRNGLELGSVVNPPNLPPPVPATATDGKPAPEPQVGRPTAPTAVTMNVCIVTRGAYPQWPD